MSTETAQGRSDFDSKFWGQYQAAKYGAPRIRRGGSIVFFSGMYSQRPVVGQADVAAINGAIESLGRALAMELSPLRVNVVSPGLTQSPAYDAMPPDQRETLFRQVRESLPARRLGQPEDIAQAVLYLIKSNPGDPCLKAGEEWVSCLPKAPPLLETPFRFR